MTSEHVRYAPLPAQDDTPLKRSASPPALVLSRPYAPTPSEDIINLLSDEEPILAPAPPAARRRTSAAEEDPILLESLDEHQRDGKPRMLPCFSYVELMVSLSARASVDQISGSSRGARANDCISDPRGFMPRL